MKAHTARKKQRVRGPGSNGQAQLHPSDLRWRCTEKDIVRALKENAEITTEIIGQERALRALHIGLEMKQYGYNIFVTGVPGTGRTTTVRRLLQDFEHAPATLTDKCYVYNFHDPDSPRMIALPSGQGVSFKKDMETFVRELLKGVPSVFESRRYQEQRKQLLEHFQNRQRSVLKDFERKVKERGFEVVQVQGGPGVRPEIAPVIEGVPITLEQLLTKVEKGEMDADQVKTIESQQNDLEAQMELVMREMRNIERKAKRSMEELMNKMIIPLVLELLEDLRSRYTTKEAHEYLGDVEKEVLSNIERFNPKEEQTTSVLGVQIPREDDEMLEFKVNVIVDHSTTRGVPIIFETNPRYKNLFGTIERVIDRQGNWRTDLTHIKSGSLLKADGGFLVLNVIDVLIEPWVWSTLKRVLRNRQTEIQTPESNVFGASSGLKPEPIGINVKVIILGDSYVYRMLYEYDEDFKKIFKVRADFDVEMKRDDRSIAGYLSFVRSTCAAEGLPSFENEALAEIVEYGVRLAGDQRKLSTRFNLIADAIREAGYWASKGNSTTVRAGHVREAIRQRIERLNLVEEKIQEMIVDGSIMIDTKGSVVGQVNGLSVYQMGEYEFGKPSRITAKTSAGQSGIINIEREVELSGPIHDKGVLILGGYLRWKYAQHKQLMVSASIAFEQSYNGVEGDSASATEVFALLSSLSDLPVRQDIAVTGSINQHGEIQPIGGVNAKIEGFFDVCKERGLAGSEGVIIPHQNVRDLMLRHDVVDAVAKERFHIYAIKNVDEGVAILMGKPAGKVGKGGKYPPESVHGRVSKKLLDLAHGEKKKGKRR